MKTLLFISLLLLASCTEKRDTPDYSLFIRNTSHDKELVAEFYQSHTAYDECMEIAKRWDQKQPTCEMNEKKE